METVNDVYQTNEPIRIDSRPCRGYKELSKLGVNVCCKYVLVTVYSCKKIAGLTLERAWYEVILKYFTIHNGQFYRVYPVSRTLNQFQLQ